MPSSKKPKKKVVKAFAVTTDRGVLTGWEILNVYRYVGVAKTLAKYANLTSGRTSSKSQLKVVPVTITFTS